MTWYNLSKWENRFKEKSLDVGVEGFTKEGFKLVMGGSSVWPDWIFPTLMCNLSP